jgi:YD repeat-containing protein
MLRLVFLVLTAVTVARANAQVSTSQLIRTSEFEYDLTTGLLIREVIEPSDPLLCLVKTYAHDAYGNKTSVTTRNCNGSLFNNPNPAEASAPPCPGPSCIQPRTSTASFAAAPGNGWPGQFPTSGTNAFGHLEQRQFDQRFGTITSLTGPNNLTTTWTYDPFGRKQVETRSDGTTTTWNYERCVDPAAAGKCPAPLAGQTASLAQYRVRVDTTGAPETSTYYDTLNRVIRTETQGFDGTLVRKDTQYDSLGRVAKVSQAFVTEGTQVWTAFTYDILNRVTVVDEPVVNGIAKRTRTDYSTNQGNQVTTVTVGAAGTGTSVTGTGMPGGIAQVSVTTKNSQGQVVESTVVLPAPPPPPPPPPAPTVSISANPSSVTSGTSSTLTWSSTNATSCSASGAWSGAEPRYGTQSTGALTATSAFSLTCTGAGGSATASAQVTVTPPAPTVSISANPSSVTSGTFSTLTWSSTNATSCTASGAWSGAEPSSGTQSTGALTATGTFSLTCTGAGGSATGSAQVTVTPPPPTVSISANPSLVSSGNSSTLTWSSTNATSCTASGAWSGAKPSSGTQSTGAVNVTSTFSLTCTGGGGNATGSATVRVHIPTD